MKDIKKFLTKLDLFGVNLNFKYQANDTYTTALGGLFILMFGIVALSFGIYYFIPFIKRKNLNIIYYTMNIPKTEQIKFKESKAMFNIGFQCDGKNDTDIQDIFNLNSNFVIFYKDSQGNSNKTKEELTWHYCRYEDFYNNYNESVDFLGFNNFHCLDDIDRTIEGIFSDKIFTYYEFSLTNKHKTKENYDRIYQYLSHNDCKLVIYYTDITIDLSDYKKPIKPFLNPIFIQLNQTLNIKRNVYFMNQYLFDDDKMFAVFTEDEKPKQIVTLFSRYEEYSLYLGLEFNENSTEYAKVFIRADTKRTIIKRTYQKLTEFYADASSLLIALYEILIIIFSYINNFYAEQSITNKLFFFKELDQNRFNYFKKYQKIPELKKRNSISHNIRHLDTIQNDLNIKKPYDIKRKSKNKIVNDKSKSSCSSIIDDLEESNHSQKDYKIYKKNISKIFENNEFPKYSMTNSNNKKKTYIKHLNKSKKENEQDINYSFNVFEIFLVTFYYKCLKGKLKLKNELNNKAKDLLYYKLDIHIYLRNMFLFDIINQTILDENKKNIINLLSRPVISMNNKEEKEEEVFYKNYKKEEFDKYFEGFIELSEKKYKEKKEKKLIILANKYLKEFW